MWSFINVNYDMHIAKVFFIYFLVISIKFIFAGEKLTEVAV